MKVLFSFSHHLEICSWSSYLSYLHTKVFIQGEEVKCPPSTDVHL